MEQQRGASSKTSRSVLDRDLTRDVSPIDAQKLLARGGITLLVLLFVFALFSHIPTPDGASSAQSGKLSQNVAGARSQNLGSQNLVGFAG
jgi:hypothetical protein